jgi:hypothetical protein
MKPPFGPSDEVTRQFIATVEKNDEKKKSYEDKLEKASGNDVYKYVLLINMSALGSYVAQARLQAQQSFNLSRIVACAGFVIVAVAVVMSVYLGSRGNQSLNPAYLTGIAGVLTEFISGVFFFLYSKTLGQINLFHDKLVEMEKTALSHLGGTDSGPRSAA